METEEEEDQDVYVSQLYEVFRACDREGHGDLSDGELQDLCQRLQLNEQTGSLIRCLKADKLPGDRVTFDEFKEGFVSVLSEAVGGLESSDDDEPNLPLDVGYNDKEVGDLPEGNMDHRIGTPESQHQHNDDADVVFPKYVKGEKRYGRRTLPDQDSEDDELNTHGILGTPAGRSTPKYRRTNHWDDMRDKKEDSHKSSSGRSSVDADDDSRYRETFEAEGQMNQSIGDLETGLDPVSEEQHLKAIWRDLGVGDDGFLQIGDLARVCRHIGMEEMNEEELQHLFDKLDSNSDGLVSFQEFLHGLFQHGGVGSHTPSTTPSRPLSTPRQKPRLPSALSISMDDQRQTPSMVLSGAGLFSALDHDGSGYAKPEVIIDFWESMGITQGAEILEYLQFDMVSKLSLSELTFALEQELHGVEEDSATSHAAIVCYQQELKHLKMCNDQITAERNKIRGDLNEANNRILILIKEGDERYNSMERSKDREIDSLEKRYQDQIKALHADIDGERQQLSHLSSKQQRRLEKQIELLKEEEVQLKDKLAQTQQELEKLESDMADMVERCADVERHNIRQQKDLESSTIIQRKLEQIQTQREEAMAETQKFYIQKVEQMELEKMELKDKNDELTMEVEDLKQNLSSNRRSKRSTRNREGVILAGKTGSFLTETGQASDEASDVSDDDDAASIASTSTTASTRARRRLPPTPDNMATENERFEQVEELRRERDEALHDRDALKEALQSQLLSLRGKHEAELTDLQRLHDEERQETEDAFQQEVLELQQEHEENMKKTNEETVKQKGRLQRQLTEKDSETKKQLERERENLMIRTESEKNLIQQRFAEEKAQLVARMEDTYSEDVKVQMIKQEERHSRQLEDLMTTHEKAILQMKADHTRQLEQTVTHDKEDFNKLHLQKAEMELQMRLQKEELELQGRQERLSLQEKWENERSQLLEKHRLQILDYDGMLAKGVSGLSGRLAADFQTLLEQHRQEVAEKERQKAEKQADQRVELEKQHADVKAERLNSRLNSLLKENMEKERDELVQEHKRQIVKLEKEHQQELSTLKEEHSQSHLRQQEVVQKHEQEMTQLRHQHQLELNEAERLVERVRHEAGQHLIKERHEWQKEKQQLELQKKTCEESAAKERELLKRQVEEERLQRQQEMVVLQTQEKRRAQADASLQQQKMVEDLEGEIHERLELEFMDQIRQLKIAFEDERHGLNSRVNLLQRELEEQSDHNNTTEKEIQLRQKVDELNYKNAALVKKNYKLDDEFRSTKHNLENRIQQLENERDSSKPVVIQTNHQTRIDDLDRDKRILMAINGQTNMLESRTNELRQQIQGMNGTSSTNSSLLQHEVDRMRIDKELLEEALNNMETKARDLLGESLEGQQYKAQLSSWETERAALRQQLNLTTDKLAEMNTALSMTNSKHVRELHNLREAKNGMIDMNKYNAATQHMTELRQQVATLEAAMEQRSAETTKLLAECRESREKAVNAAQAERDDLQSKLTTTSRLLSEQVVKLKEQMEKNSKTDLLVKDLYVENSHLTKCLHVTERREKDSASALMRIREKNVALQKVLKKLCPIVA